MSGVTPPATEDTGGTVANTHARDDRLQREGRRIGLQIALEYVDNSEPTTDGGLSTDARAWLESVDGADARDATQWQVFRDVSQELEERLSLPHRARDGSHPNQDRARLMNEARSAAAQYLRLTADTR
jgi:hypothetical protein